jgi:hypothetical protein
MQQLYLRSLLDNNNNNKVTVIMGMTTITKPIGLRITVGMTITVITIGLRIKRLERCTLSTVIFQRCSSHHITGVNISRETKRITNATIISKAALVYCVIVEIM